MATTRKTTTRKPAATRRASTTAKSSTENTSRAKTDPSLAARTGRTVKERPYVSAAIATGAVTAVAAAAAGAYFFSRRDQSIGETAEELGARIKDGLSEAKTMVSGLGKKAGQLFDKTAGKSQENYAAEALMLKQTGKPGERPVDPLVADQIKAGAVSY